MKAINENTRLLGKVFATLVWMVVIGTTLYNYFFSSEIWEPAKFALSIVWICAGVLIILFVWISDVTRQIVGWVSLVVALLALVGIFLVDFNTATTYFLAPLLCGAVTFKCVLAAEIP